MTACSIRIDALLNGGGVAPDGEDGTSLEDRMRDINISNRKRSSSGDDSPFKKARCRAPTKNVAFSDDVLHYGGDLRLPYLPFAFYRTCGLCGKTGIITDKKGMMPLQFLAEFLDTACARSPFVFNVLYQMAHYPHLEIEEAEKWQRIHGRRVPNALRGRICICAQCMPPIKERAQCKSTQQERTVEEEQHIDERSWGQGRGDGLNSLITCLSAALSSIPDRAPSPGDDDDKSEGVEAEGFDPSHVVPTEVAFAETMDPHYDVWEIRYGKRIVHSKTKYQGRTGRNFSQQMLTMVPMDIVLLMLVHPDSNRVPEYRMLTRLLRTLAGLSSGAVEDSNVNKTEESRCLYLSFPILAMHTLVAQIRSNQIELKGMLLRGRGTISDRVHLSAYASGGKRRVTRGDSQHAIVVRRCHGMLNSGEGPEPDSSTRKISLGGFKTVQAV